MHEGLNEWSFMMAILGEYKNIYNVYCCVVILFLWGFVIVFPVSICELSIPSLGSLISLIFPPSNPVENYCIRIIQCMFDKGLEKLGFIQSSVGGFNVQILNQTKISFLPHPPPRAHHTEIMTQRPASRPAATWLQPPLRRPRRLRQPPQPHLQSLTTQHSLRPTKEPSTSKFM